MLQSKATLLISKSSQSAVRAKVNEDAWSWSRLNWLWGEGGWLGLVLRGGVEYVFFGKTRRREKVWGHTDD